MLPAAKEELIKCPYDVSHQILKSRMAVHIIKCRQQHSVCNFKTCPFNTFHDVPEQEFEYHINVCPDRKNLENYIYVVGETKTDEIPVNLEIPPSSENWDEDEDTSSYLDYKDKRVEENLIFRNPVGMTKSERKHFFQNEVIRFTKVSNNNMGRGPGNSANMETKSPAGEGQMSTFKKQ